MANPVQEERFWHWRNTMKPVRFFRFDARAGFFCFLLLVHARYWTLFLTIAVLIIFWILERKGLSFSSAIRALRMWFVGNYRPAWVSFKKRKMHDSGS